MKQQPAPTLPTLRSFRIGSVKKVLSMTHDASRPKVASEFKIRAVRSSQSARNPPTSQAPVRSLPLKLLASEPSEQSVKCALRRPTKPHPRSGQHCRNIPNGVIVQSQVQEEAPIPCEQIKLGRIMSTSEICEVRSSIWEGQRRFVAIKQYRDCFTNQDIKRELARTRHLVHPNLVKYEGCMVKDNRKQVIMELVDGGSLSSFLSQFGTFNETLIRKYARQLLEALLYLKSKNSFHGRVRCENLLSDLNGNIKLTLPRSKSTGAEDHQRYLYWSAPEVIAGAAFTQKSEVWSFGCTLLEMAIGLNPWGGETACLTTFKRDINSGATPTIPSHLSEDCRSLIASCLKSDSTDRPPLQYLKEMSFLKKL